VKTKDGDSPEYLGLPEMSPPLKLVLKSAREKLGLSQEALAVRLGYERTVIARIETGRTARPPLTFLANCEKILDLVPGTLQRLVSVDEGSKRHLGEEERAHEYSRVYRSFPYTAVDELFSTARQRIRILQTWIADINPFMPGIQKALSSGAQLEILVLDPRCAAASLRLQNLEISRETYPVLQLAKLMIDLERLQITTEGTWKVRTHRFSNSIPMYATERTTILGFYWNLGFSMQGPQVEASTQHSAIGEMAWREFDYLWSSGLSVSAADVDLENWPIH
jgi:transcriptional regulator with XRE-family HTH domain